jgi:Arm DNA-binding domain
LPFKAVLWKPWIVGGISGESRKRFGGISPFSKFGGVMSLTDTEIRKSKPGTKAYRLADTKGLFLFVTPTGGELWRYKYRHGGLQKLMAIGKYPDVPLALARERHAEARRQLSSSIDEILERLIHFRAVADVTHS